VYYFDFTQIILIRKIQSMMDGGVTVAGKSTFAAFASTPPRSHRYVRTSTRLSRTIAEARRGLFVEENLSISVKRPKAPLR
jgi:hypothetical protein